MSAPRINARTPVFDSGWRDVTADLQYEATGNLHIRRVGDKVYWRILGQKSGTTHQFWYPPAGFRVSPPAPMYLESSIIGISADRVYLATGGAMCRYSSAAVTSTAFWESGSYLLAPGTAEPSVLPGVAV